MRRFTPLFMAAALVAIALGCSSKPPTTSVKSDPPAADKPAEVAAAETPQQQQDRALARLRRLAVAAFGHNDAMMRFPAAAIAGKDGKPLLSWRVTVLRFLEDDTPPAAKAVTPDTSRGAFARPVSKGQALYDKFKLDEPWDSDHNKKVAADNPMPDVFATPGLGDAVEKETLMQAFTGNGAAFDATGRRFPTDFPDGAVATIFFAVAAKGVPWTKPADMPFDPKLNPADQLLKSPLGAYLTVMADGTPKALSAKNSAETMRALVTAAGGERVTLEQLAPPAP